ncbi:MAG: folate-binding protein [Paracoccaceae bacterium]
MLPPVLDPACRCAPHDGRAFLRVSGPDRHDFLQGLVTQDMARVARDGIAYGALLTPQGKLVADFLLVDQGESGVVLDLPEGWVDDILNRLTLYKLRARVTLTQEPGTVTRGVGPAPNGALADPRSAALGWRLYGHALGQGVEPDWTELRIAHLIPESGLEAVPGESFILELGFERLHGVDFRKGCYVGQEVTARMHHKTDLRRGLFVVRLTQPVPPGTAVTLEDGREAGAVYSQSGCDGLALLRHDRANGALRAGDAVVTVVGK